VSSTHDLVSRVFSSSLRCTSTLCLTSRTSRQGVAAGPNAGVQDDRAAPAPDCARGARTEPEAARAVGTQDDYASTLCESERPLPGVVDVATRRISAAAAWESAMDLPPKGMTVVSTTTA
jgi:hypothetical protein